MKTQIFFFILATALVNMTYAQHFTAQFTGLGSVENTSPYHMVAVNDSIIWASSSSPKVELFANAPNLIVHSVDGGITWITDTLQVDLQYPGNFYISCISAIGSVVRGSVVLKIYYPLILRIKFMRPLMGAPTGKFKMYPFRTKKFTVNKFISLTTLKGLSLPEVQMVIFRFLKLMTVGKNGTGSRKRIFHQS